MGRFYTRATPHSLLPAIPHPSARPPAHRLHPAHLFILAVWAKAAFDQRARGLTAVCLLRVTACVCRWSAAERTTHSVHVELRLLVNAWAVVEWPALDIRWPACSLNLLCRSHCADVAIALPGWLRVWQVHLCTPLCVRASSDPPSPCASMTSAHARSPQACHTAPPRSTSLRPVQWQSAN
jgi:hypothetical protein